MTTSLVARLTAIVAAIIVLAFAAGAWIVHRSTATTYRDVQREVQMRTGGQPPNGDLVAALNAAYAEGQWGAVRQYTAGRGPGSPAFLILDLRSEIAVSSRAEWQSATVRARPDGSFILTREERRGGRVDIQELATTAATELGGAGRVWGRLIVVPEADRAEAVDAGAAFASQFWRTAAIWLAGVLTAAVAGLVWVMHRSLAPVADLVEAARTLQRGGAPRPLRPSGAAEFRELLDAFNAAAESIARTERVRRDLISDIAHELRTPLTNIRGQLEAVQAGLIRPEDECLATLQAETKLLERLVDDIHQLALSDAGQLRVHVQPLPLRETIEQLARPLAAATGARLTISGPSNLWCVADDERLRQVLGNLIDNSARHRPDGLDITITLSREGSWVTASVNDNGPGVAPADQPHIFDRFYRADKSRSRASGGAGLGLPIARGLLQAMGGSIRYESRAPGGATFVLSLPAAPAPRG